MVFHILPPPTPSSSMVTVGSGCSLVGAWIIGIVLSGCPPEITLNLKKTCPQLPPLQTPKCRGACVYWLWWSQGKVPSGNHFVSSLLVLRAADRLHHLHLPFLLSTQTLRRNRSFKVIFFNFESCSVVSDSLMYDQLRDQCMVSHVLSAWSGTWRVHNQPRGQCMISHENSSCTVT